MPDGTPKYTQDLGDRICALIAEGTSLRKIAAMEGYPAMSTMLDWVLKGDRGDVRYSGFSEQYAHAMDIRTEMMGEEILEIADASNADVIVSADGRPIVDGEVIQRSKVKIDTRKWLMGKLKPKKYGERNTTTLAGDPENPLQTSMTVHFVDGPGDDSVSE